MKKEKTHSNKHLVLIFSGLCLVVCGLIVAVIVVANSNKLVINTYEEASTYLADYMDYGDPEGFIEAGDRALSAATDDDVKAYIYLLRSSMLFNYNIGSDNKYLAQMLSDAYDAESLNPTAQSAYEISTYEEMLGNIEKAEEYLEIAKDRGLLDSPGRG